jgi:hypothetical protein
MPCTRAERVGTGLDLSSVTGHPGPQTKKPRKPKSVVEVGTSQYIAGDEDLPVELLETPVPLVEV